MKSINKSILLIVVTAVLLNWQVFSGDALALVVRARAANSMANAPILLQIKPPASMPVLPFMHQPFAGPATLKTRTVTYFDHDRPGLGLDNYFVRYDGFTSRTPASKCQPGVSCADGSAGYIYNLNHEAVLSPAVAQVVRAGWYNPINHNSAFGLYIMLDYGNRVMSVFGNLSSLNVAVGDKIGIQTQIAISGGSGAATVPQLSMNTYYLPYMITTDPNGWQGKKADPNLVSDSILWVAQPAPLK